MKNSYSDNAKKRVLIISGEAWNDDINPNSPLTNLFEPLKDIFEFAHIYTSSDMPKNSICNCYFHISEAKVIKSFFHRKPFGSTLLLDVKEHNVTKKTKPYLKKTFIKKNFRNIGLLAHNIIWKFSIWKTEDLSFFIKKFNPDVIFAPMYYKIHLHRIDRYVAQVTGKKIISYVYDDHLTFKHFSFSPFFWLNRIILRYNVKKTAKYYSLLYTMTKEQLDEYQPILKTPMRILTKSGNFDLEPSFKENYSFPIRLIYAGNLIYNRYKTLNKLAEIIKKINKDYLFFQLDIYTQTPITEKHKKMLHDGQNSILHGKISSEELKEEYEKSDILLHVESFDLQQKLVTRISFSTKIVDLLSSGRAVMAICWEKSSPYKHLKRNDAAICISDLSEIQKELLKIKNNPMILQTYAKKAWACGVKNHNSHDITSMIVEDFSNSENT